MIFYTLREKAAYSVIGKYVATLVRNAYYPTARIHWVQQAMADLSCKKLPRKL